MPLRSDKAGIAAVRVHLHGDHIVDTIQVVGLIGQTSALDRTLARPHPPASHAHFA